MPYQRDLPQSVMNAKDDDLIQQIASGERQAFEELYQHYLPRLIRYLQNRLSQPDLVEDVCQDVFCVVWRQASHFRGQSKVSTWLFGIARCQALKARAGVQRPESPLEAVGVSQQSSPEVSLSAWQRVRVVERALAALTTSQRELVEMAYYQDRPCQEIASRLGCSVSTVKSRLQQARRQLSRHLRRADRAVVTP